MCLYFPILSFCSSVAPLTHNKPPSPGLKGENLNENTFNPKEVGVLALGRTMHTEKWGSSGSADPGQKGL